MRRWMTEAELRDAEDEARTCAQVHTGAVMPDWTRQTPSIVSGHSDRHYRVIPWVPAEEEESE